MSPYTALPAGGVSDWWYVADCRGLNVLSFPEKPGAKFTTEVRAKEIAAGMNVDLLPDLVHPAQKPSGS